MVILRSTTSWFALMASRSTPEDRKSTRLNSSHSQISYAVFCLKKKNNHDDVAVEHQAAELDVTHLFQILVGVDLEPELFAPPALTERAWIHRQHLASRLEDDVP